MAKAKDEQQNMGFRKPTKRSNRGCDFCDSPDGCNYIYPLPEEYRDGLFLGKLACSECFPPIRQAQYDEGILLPPVPVELDTSWQEDEDE